MKPVIETHALCKSYHGRLVVDHLDLCVPEGCVYGFLGPNGAGKSTLLSAVSQELPYAGLVTLDGTDLRRMKPRQLARRMAMLRQLSDLAYAYTVEEVVAMGRYAHRGLLQADSGGAEAVERALQAVQLQDKRRQNILTLSGGERQRMLLAQVLCQEPDVLLLDEPTNHLDMDSREVLEDALENFPGTILAISHDRYFINRFATKVCVLEAGGVKEYLGNYDDYFEKINRQQAPDSENAGMTKTAMDKEKRKSREEEKRIREKKNAIAAAEKAIATAEEAAEMEAQLADPATYQDAEKAAQLAKAYQLKKDEIERRYAEWEALSAEE